MAEARLDRAVGARHRWKSGVGFKRHVECLIDVGGGENGQGETPWGTLGKEGGPAIKMTFAPTFILANYLIMNPTNMA